MATRQTSTRSSRTCDEGLEISSLRETGEKTARSSFKPIVPAMGFQLGSKTTKEDATSPSKWPRDEFAPNDQRLLPLLLLLELWMASSLNPWIHKSLLKYSNANGTNLEPFVAGVKVQILKVSFACPSFHPSLSPLPVLSRLGCLPASLLAVANRRISLLGYRRRSRLLRLRQVLGRVCRRAYEVSSRFSSLPSLVPFVFPPSVSEVLTQLPHCLVIS